MSHPVRGENDLPTLLGSLAPRLDPETYWFCHLASAAVPTGLPILARIDEDEGATIVVPAHAAEQASLSATFVARRLVLTVHSDLGAVGMMAAVATALAERGLPCNVFAGIYHDHLFVSPEDAPHALSALEELQASARSGIRIVYLCDQPAAIEQLAEWHFAEWHHLIPGWSVGEAAAELASHRGRQMIPTTFVALHGIEIVGSASLLLEDMPGTEAWSPWLASVYVAPAWRGRGIRRRLVQRAIAEAVRLEVPVLYLLTTGTDAWYLRQGWAVVDRRPGDGQAARIMHLDLSRERTTLQRQTVTPWRRTMSEWSDRWQGVLADFERQRDELKVRVHLAKAETRDEMARLESRMDALRVKAQSAGSEAREALRDIGGAAEQLANEIRIGLDRIRKTL
jgi:predicted N-acetyltransferase YhbS